MESLSTAEIVELVFLQRQNLDAQFQFWMSITFAFIAATFVARNRMSFRLKAFIGLLYALCTISLSLRYLYEGGEISLFHAELVSRQIDVVPPIGAFVSRALVVVLGSVGSLVYLFVSDNQERSA